MNKKMLEKMSEKIHNIWVNESIKQGKHHPSVCPDERIGCLKCNESLIPYNDLPECIKELNRVIVKEFENSLADLGAFVISSEDHALCFKSGLNKDFDDFIDFIKTNIKLGNNLIQIFWFWCESRKFPGLEVYCPHCGWDKKNGSTLFDGRIAHACDPGCCSTLYCTKCGRVYGLKENETQHYDFKKHTIKTTKIEKYFKKKEKKK